MSERLSTLRKNIQDTDRRILQLAKRRLEFVKEISRIKHDLDLPIVDREVENKVLQHAFEVSSILQLDKNFVKKLINILVDESVRLQKLNDSSGSKKHV